MTQNHVAASKKNSGQERFLWLKRLWEAKYLLLWVSLLTLATEGAGCFRGTETAALDSFITVFTEPRKAPHIVIVGIQDHDYQQIFEATSPLKAERVRDLVDAIALGSPRTIGVDLDTSADQFRGFQHAPGWPAVVWARGATQISEDKGFIEKVSDAIKAILKPFIKEQNQHQDLFQTGDVLGADKIAPKPLSGIALLPQDGDGLIRRYRRVFNTIAADSSSGKTVVMDSFPWAIVQAYCDHSEKNPYECKKIDPMHKGGQTTAELVLNFAGDRYRFQRIDASEILRLAKTEGWKTDGPLKDKIVLLGGFYRAGRDEYVTPVGPMAGVELIGQAIESDLEGRGIRPANHFLMFVMEILVGISLVYLHHRFESSRLVLLAIPVFLLLGSFVAFKSLAYWASFVPILFAVRMHKRHNHAIEDRELREKLQEYRKRYGELDDGTSTQVASPIREGDTDWLKKSSNPYIRIKQYVFTIPKILRGHFRLPTTILRRVKSVRSKKKL